MKIFRVSLSIGVTFIEADHFVETGTKVEFYRAGSLVAQYPRVSVLEITESPNFGQERGLLRPIKEDGAPGGAPPHPETPPQTPDAETGADHRVSRAMRA